MKIEKFYDLETGTWSYVVVDTVTQACAIIDPVLHYNAVTGRTSTELADKIIAYIEQQRLENQWILETHIHADHITAAAYLQKKVGGQTGISAKIKDVLSFWVPRFDIEEDTPLDGRQFDVLFEEGQVFQIGALVCKVWQTPGHTPACISYLIEDAVFVGDTIFAPTLGTARCDFPGGSASDLYESIQRFYTLPDATQLFLCHDYPVDGASPRFCYTVGEQKCENILVHSGISKQEYIGERKKRDKKLGPPQLLYPSLQMNMRLGSLGQAAANGIHYIKIPLNSM